MTGEEKNNYVQGVHVVISQNVLHSDDLKVTVRHLPVVTVGKRRRIRPVAFVIADSGEEQRPPSLAIVRTIVGEQTECERKIINE